MFFILGSCVYYSGPLILNTTLLLKTSKNSLRCLLIGEGAGLVIGGRDYWNHVESLIDVDHPPKKPNTAIEHHFAQLLTMVYHGTDQKPSCAFRLRVCGAALGILLWTGARWYSGRAASIKNESPEQRMRPLGTMAVLRISSQFPTALNHRNIEIDVFLVHHFKTL